MTQDIQLQKVLVDGVIIVMGRDDVRGLRRSTSRSFNTVTSITDTADLRERIEPPSTRNFTVKLLDFGFARLALIIKCHKN